jgi:hypothetical protein
MILSKTVANELVWFEAFCWPLLPVLSVICMRACRATYIKRSQTSHLEEASTLNMTDSKKSSHYYCGYRLEVRYRFKAMVIGLLALDMAVTYFHLWTYLGPIRPRLRSVHRPEWSEVLSDNIALCVSGWRHVPEKATGLHDIPRL